jgi:hypothetical protein
MAGSPVFDHQQNFIGLYAGSAIGLSAADAGRGPGHWGKNGDKPVVNLKKLLDFKRNPLIAIKSP